MKTLDEVIEIASDWTNGFDEMSIEKQMLHYLREYREMLNTRIYIPEGYTREKTGFTHQDFANTFREEPHFIRDFMVGTSQNSADTSQKITCPKCHSEFVILPEANNALTWDELRMMEGKPVWIEDPGRKEWMIIDHVVDEDTKYERLYIQSFYPRSFYKHDHQWQAYRKERS